MWKVSQYIDGKFKTDTFGTYKEKIDAQNLADSLNDTSGVEHHYGMKVEYKVENRRCYG
ncbi:MAG: hypothetical protein WC208_14115 [Gallionella sp.]|jgi:hypothetical protein